MTTTPPLLVEISPKGIATLTLNRPEKHNALDDDLIRKLTEQLLRIDSDSKVRAVVLTGSGASFCAGADVAWMRSMADYGESENIEDATRLAELLATLDGLSKPTLARINGHAFGGGVGLIACCDIAITQSEAQFGLPEVQLGLIPAVISPYVIATIGLRHARRLFLSGERFTAKQARRIGLIHEIVNPNRLDAATNDQLTLLLNGGPQAQREAKALIAQIAAHPQQDFTRLTVELIARLRLSPEGREGLQAFLEKQRPGWAG